MFYAVIRSRKTTLYLFRICWDKQASLNLKCQKLPKNILDSAYYENEMLHVSQIWPTEHVFFLYRKT